MELNLALQQLSPALDGIMRALSFLGQEEFFIILIAFLYWCIDTRFAVRLLSLLALSDFTNILFKWMFHTPRPYWIDARVKALSTETSYGLPSGHAQTAITVWGYFVCTIKRGWILIVALIVVVGISISRIYLGVHFAGDVIGGLIIGAIVLALFVWAEPRIAHWIAPKSIGFQIGAALVGSLSLLALTVIVRAMISTVIDPAGWTALAGPIDPRNPEGAVSDAAIIFGAYAGLALMVRTAHFDVQGAWRKRITRFVLGLMGVLIVRFGLGAIFPHDQSIGAMILRYSRYALMVLWAVWLAPWLFIRLRLADRVQ